MTDTDNVTELDPTEKLINDAVREHGQVAIFKTDHGVVIYKCPDLASYERFTDKIAGDSPTSAAMRELCYACVVTPDLQALKVIFEKMPALPLKSGKRIQQLAGSKLEGDIKKA